MFQMAAAGGISPILWAVVALELCQSFLWKYVDRRQLKHLKKVQYSKELENIMNEDDFKASKSYALDKMNFGLVKDTFSQVLGLFLLLNFYLPWIYRVSLRVAKKWFGSDNEYLVALVFMLLQQPLDVITDLPFSLYNDFVLEERHGFNKKTLKLFFVDMLKGFLVELLLMPPILSLLIFVIKWGGDSFYYYLWATVMVLQFLMMWVYPTFIQPLFNKVEPLRDAVLRDKIYDLAGTVKYPLTKIYEIDESRRSAHSNAYLYGFGRNKRIVLFDTLLKTSHERIVAVVAHELGHWKLSHTIKQMIFGSVQLFVLFYVFRLFVYSTTLYEAFGFVGVGHPVIIGLLLFTRIISPISMVLGLVSTILTRRFEFQADAFACSLGKSKDLQGALIELHTQNKGTPSYDPVYAWCHLSHPHIIERLRALQYEDDVYHHQTTGHVTGKSKKEL